MIRLTLFLCLILPGIEQQTPTERADALIAEAMKNLRNPTVALRYADTAYQISTKANYERGIALASKVRGSMYAFLGKADSGYYYQQKALVIFDKLSDTLEIAKVTYNMSIYHNSRAEYEKSLALSLKALKNFELVQDRNGIGRALNIIGQTYYYQENYEQALVYFRAHLKNSVLAGDSMEIASSWSNIGAALSDVEQNDSARFYLSKAIALKEQLGAVATLGSSYFNLATLYADEGAFKEAEIFYRKAIDQYATMGDSSRMAEYYQTHALLYQKQKKYQEAVKELDLAIRIARQTVNRQIERNALGTLAEVYAAQGNYMKAYQALSEYAKASEALTNEQNAEMVNRLRTEYETERKELELAENKIILAETSLRVQERNNQLIIAGGMLLVISIASLLIYRNQKAKQRQVEIEADLKTQLAEVEAKNALQQERLRISRELHDNIGSQLTFINSSIDSAGQSARMEEVKKLTLDTIRELRKTVWLVNQSDVTIDEFAVKLREYLNPGASLPITVIISGDELDKKVSSPVATHIFRVIQEAVNNSIKHAQASHISVELNARQEALEVTVRDNGIGFLTDTVKSGHGLRNMRERIASVNGTFSLTSQAGETRITIQIPVAHLS